MPDYTESPQPLMVDGHVNLGHDSTVPLPDRFTAPDNSTFCPQGMGGSALDGESGD